MMEARSRNAGVASVRGGSRRGMLPRPSFFFVFGVMFGIWISQPLNYYYFTLNSPNERFAPNPSNDFELAEDQSFGFFTDVRESDWKLSQKLHARIFPNHYGTNLNRYSNGPNDKGNIKKLRASNWWNGQNFQVEFHCPHSARIPSTGEMDGPKWVCDPHRLAKKKDCLVYSVGSNGNVMFERGVHDEISPHCEIHTFDLIKERNIKGKKVDFATVLEPYSTFHHWGISNENTRRTKTLRETMKILGHEGRSIDIFKIDCEWCEWFTYESWLAGDLRQILVETHNAPMPNAKDFFYTLHDNGYVIFNKEANYPNGAGGVEFAFLKLKTSFFVNGTMYNQTGSVA